MQNHMMVIQSETDIYIILSTVKQSLRECHFSVIDQQKILVSVSELARNVLDHAGQKGWVSWDIDSEQISISVVDEGPGIANYQDILDGKVTNTASRGLGIGLSGTRRLMDEFSIETSERGTRILVTKRKSPV